MSQNGQTHFKNLASFAARFLKCAYHFGTLWIKGLKLLLIDSKLKRFFQLEALLSISNNTWQNSN